MKKTNIQKQISTLFVNKLYELSSICDALKAKRENAGNADKQKISHTILINQFAICEINNLFEAVSRAFYLNSLMKDN